MRIFSASYPASALAFDKLAKDYDELFTESPIGKAQREAVWAGAQGVFAPGIRLLELNCGTGEDALHFARQGLDVTACDISTEMIFQAKEKAMSGRLNSHLRFYACAIEDIAGIPFELPFEGVFSNFSGLNCVEDLRTFAEQLAKLVAPRSPMLLCFSTRYCLWETAWYLMRGKAHRAFRRWSGYHLARISDIPLPVYYPTLQQIRRCFAPHFDFVSVKGIGITVPPSYVQPWMKRHSQSLRILQRIDACICNWPGLRVLGDHMLVQLERRVA